ncbi:MAG: phosphatase PAP2 family protein [Proteobacteria bacterium]|nr:phosphatase PAP2 family protein [Pseudomonadota bacterium]
MDTMLLWAGVALIFLGFACLPIDRRAAHYLYDHESARLERFLENTTHWAKAGHWLVAAVVAIVVAQGVLWADPAAEGAREARTFSLALIACLAVGSAVLHAMKLVVGRRRPRDDMELGLYEFVWFRFKLDYNSFPSGHALTISCVAVIATCAAPHLAVLWFAVAAWLALTRAVLTAHFLSDVFVGSGIGLLAARLTLLYVFSGLAPSWF